MSSRPLTPASFRTRRPPSTRIAVETAARRAGRPVGGVTSTWPRARRSTSRLCAPLAVELARDVVEQQHGPHAAHLVHEVGLGGEQREHRASAARPASRRCAGRARPARTRARRGAGPTDVCRARCRAGAARRELRAAALASSSARAPRSAARPAPRARRSPPGARRTARAALDEARAGAPDLRSRAAPAARPRAASASCALGSARAEPAQQVVALLQRAARSAAGDRRVARPGARDRPVEVAAAQRRRALHDRQALGGEDEDRRRARPARRSTRRARRRP